MPKENLKKTSPIGRTLGKKSSDAGVRPLSNGTDLKIGQRPISARPVQGMEQGVNGVMPSTAPEVQMPSPVAEAQKPTPATPSQAPVKEFRPLSSILGKKLTAAPQKKVDHDRLTQLAEQGDYDYDEPLAMGAESMLFTGRCGNETVVIKSVRSKLNRLFGNSHTRGQVIKLAKAKYSVKTRHILNEFNVGRLLYGNTDIPIVHIYALKRHRFLYFFDLGYDLIMEYLPGQDLGNHLLVQRLTMEEKFRICVQAFKAMNYMHRRKMVHLDIKPSNFMYHQGNLKLFDFGITTISGTKLKTMVGTAGFLSPEQIARDVVTEATDLFALGITLGTLFGGHQLTQRVEELNTTSARETAKYNLENDETSVIAELPELDEAYPGFAEILRKCSILKRSARTQTTQAIMYQLKAWVRSQECTFDLEIDW